MDNKLRAKQGLEYSLVFIWVLLTIITCSVVWNFVVNTMFIVAAMLLFGFNVVAIIKAVKKIKKFADEYDKQ